MTVAPRAFGDSFWWPETIEGSQYTKSEVVGKVGVWSPPSRISPERDHRRGCPGVSRLGRDLRAWSRFVRDFLDSRSQMEVQGITWFLWGQRNTSLLWIDGSLDSWNGLDREFRQLENQGGGKGFSLAQNRRTGPWDPFPDTLVVCPLTLDTYGSFRKSSIHLLQPRGFSKVPFDLRIPTRVFLVLGCVGGMFPFGVNTRSAQGLVRFARGVDTTRRDRDRQGTIDMSHVIPGN